MLPDLSYLGPAPVGNFAISPATGVTDSAQRTAAGPDGVQRQSPSMYRRHGLQDNTKPPPGVKKLETVVTANLVYSF